MRKHILAALLSQLELQSIVPILQPEGKQYASAWSISAKGAKKECIVADIVDSTNWSDNYTIRSTPIV